MSCRHCKHCGKDLPPKKPLGRIRLYCNVKCSNAYYHSHSTIRKNTNCVKCGGILLTEENKGYRKFCCKCSSTRYKNERIKNPKFCIKCGTEIVGVKPRVKFCKKHGFSGNHKPRQFNNCIELGCGADIRGTNGFKYCGKHAHNHAIRKVRYCKDCNAIILETNPLRRSHYCPECLGPHTATMASKANIKHHQKDPVQHKETVQRANNKKRSDAIWKLGGVCEKDPAFYPGNTECAGGRSWFEFHHRDHDGSTDPVRTLGSAAMAREICKMPHPKVKYALLCHKHHNEVDTKWEAEQKVKGIYV